MRGILVGVCWIAAVVCGLATVGAGWTAANVRSESGFVALNSRAAADADVQAAVSEIVTSRLMAEINVTGAVANFVSQALHNALSDLFAAPGFGSVWGEVVARSHQLNLTPNAAGKTVVVDLAPVAQAALDQLVGGLPVSIPAPDTILVDSGASLPSGVIEGVDSSAKYAIVGTILTALFAALMLVATRRRSVGIVWLGLGAIVVAGTWWLSLTSALPVALKHAVPYSSQLRPVVEPLQDQITGSFESLLTWVGIAGVALIVAGLVSRALTRRRLADEVPANA